MYSPDQWEIVAEVNSVTCITILSLMFGRKVASIDGPVRYIRVLLLLLYGLAWAYNLIACMLTSTNNGNYISCVLTHFNGVFVNTATKIVLYLYFIEKIHIASVPKTSRIRSPLYIINLLLLLPVFAIIILQIKYRISIIVNEFPYHCIVGLQLIATVTSLSYDILLTMLYTVTFVKFYYFPNTAQQTTHQSSSLHMMAKRNFIASITSLVMFSITYALLIGLEGTQRGLVASSSISLSLTIVCMVIHWEIQLNERGVNGDKPVRLEIKQHQEVVILTELNRL
ncbi:hypothetical protein BDB01DRAFT_528294 [Pilobolus umbonatus]|nr:hypothetical protein BDB01DRAFT_528294 [Pilobolus umbonatus]